jgi:hypothetical protein
MKNTRIILFAIAAIATTWLLHSCAHDDTIEKLPTHSGGGSTPPTTAQQRIIRDDSNNENGSMQLGSPRNNPFSLTNINLAKESIYGNNIPDKEPTHKYYKLMPTTEEHLSVLEQWEIDNKIPIFNFPLEYEILSDGDTYYDPKAPDSIYTFRYVAVPVEVALPDVPHEGIEYLYLDKSDPVLLSTSFWLTGNIKDINGGLFHGGLTQKEMDTYYGDHIHDIPVPHIPTKNVPTDMNGNSSLTIQNPLQSPFMYGFANPSFLPHPDPHLTIAAVP